MNENDLISRQAAIDSIQYAGKIGKQTCISILKRLPTVQPEVLACGSGELNTQPERTGRWEQVEVNYFADMDEEIQESMAIASMFCPRCKRYHNEVYLYGGATYGVNFCPYCGADMRPTERDSNV